MFAQLTGLISKAFGLQRKTTWLDKGSEFDSHMACALLAAFDREADEWLERHRGRLEAEAAIQAEYAALSSEEQYRVWDELCVAALGGQVEKEHFYLIWKDGFRLLNVVN
jgi:hypothetical protein